MRVYEIYGMVLTRYENMKMLLYFLQEIRGEELYKIIYTKSIEIWL